jgi:flagellar biosynthesis protein FlhB
MPDKGQQTEKPTKRKLEKARREGQFPSSREFLAALQFFTFTVLLRARWATTFSPPLFTWS